MVECVAGARAVDTDCGRPPLTLGRFQRMTFQNHSDALHSERLMHFRLVRGVVDVNGVLRITKPQSAILLQTPQHFVRTVAEPTRHSDLQRTTTQPQSEHSKNCENR